ncbi:MAG: helix-turn-helix transcriptional regulator [Azospirillaceae bacterium]
MHIGSRIRSLRRLVGVSQPRLAERVGLTFQQIQKYETGLNRISVSRLWQIATALDASVAFFFEGLDKKLNEQQPGGSAPEAANGNAQNGDQKEAESIVAAYREIDNPRIRRSFMELVRSVTPSNG